MTDRRDTGGATASEPGAEGAISPAYGRSTSGSRVKAEVSGEALVAEQLGGETCLYTQIADGTPRTCTTGSGS